MQTEVNNTGATNLMWTGGWDSTFRLLQLLLIKKNKVRPYYIVNKNRKSTSIELERIHIIKKKLFHQYPFTTKLLLPLIQTHSKNIKIDTEISRIWRKIRNRRHIGEQYKMLASFCIQENISNVELSLEKQVGGDQVELTNAYILAQDEVPDEEKILFRNFTFPLIHTTKKEMISIAKKEKWLSILSETWFCHRPIHIPLIGPIPCGACNPCTIALNEGLGSRIPLPSKLIGPAIKKIYHKF